MRVPVPGALVAVGVPVTVRVGVGVDRICGNALRNAVTSATETIESPLTSLLRQLLHGSQNCACTNRAKSVSSIDRLQSTSPGVVNTLPATQVMICGHPGVPARSRRRRGDADHERRDQRATSDRTCRLAARSAASRLRRATIRSEQGSHLAAQ